jgi:hypothetical protein
MMSRALLIFVFLGGACRMSVPIHQQRTAMPHSVAGAMGSQQQTVSPSVRLAFDDFFEKGKLSLTPTPTLAAANGKRVRMVGHMARMEIPPSDGFYLVRKSLDCDEAGGGTADLPPDAVRVVMTRRAGAMQFVPGLVEVQGRLELGYKEHPDGTVSQIRVILISGDGSAGSVPEAPEKNPTSKTENPTSIGG